MRVLFICEGNMMRSQMAEAFYNALTKSNDAVSAGATAEAKDHISERAIETMSEIDYDVTNLTPTQLTEKMVDDADKIIYFPSDYMPDYVKNSPRSELWNVVDPHYHKEQGMELVQQVRDDIKIRVEKFIRSSDGDRDYLKRATEIGNQKAKPYNFGAVIVKDGEVIGEGSNHVHEEHDPTLHAETSAIKKACKTVGSHNLDGATMYGSHEPCLMCFSCAAWAGVDRVVYAVSANEQDFMYEFEGYSLKDMAKHLTRRKITVEHVLLGKE